MEYIWNSKTNCFDVYKPKYNTIVGADGKEYQVLIKPSSKVYTITEVDNILNNRPQGTVIKDIGGDPSLVMYEGE